MKNVVKNNTESKSIYNAICNVASQGLKSSNELMKSQVK